MPVKINELVIQVKVYETNKQLESTKNMSVSPLLHTTEQQKLALKRDLLKWLEDQESR